MPISKKWSDDPINYLNEYQQFKAKEWFDQPAIHDYLKKNNRTLDELVRIFQQNQDEPIDWADEELWYESLKKAVALLPDEEIL